MVLGTSPFAHERSCRCADLVSAAEWSWGDLVVGVFAATAGALVWTNGRPGWASPSPPRRSPFVGTAAGNVHGQPPLARTPGPRPPPVAGRRSCAARRDRGPRGARRSGRSTGRDPSRAPASTGHVLTCGGQMSPMRTRLLAERRLTTVSSLADAKQLADEADGSARRRDPRHPTPADVHRRGSARCHRTSAARTRCRCVRAITC